MEGNHLRCDPQVTAVGVSSTSRRKIPRNVAISITSSNDSNTSTCRSSGKVTLDREESISMTTTETSTISTDNTGCELEHDRQEGAPSKDLVEETCFECSTKFLLSLDDAIVTEVALCIECRKQQIKIEQSITNEGKKTRAPPVVKSTRKSLSSQNFMYEEDVTMDVDSCDDGLTNNTIGDEQYRGLFEMNGGDTTKEQIHYSSMSSIGSFLPSRDSKPKMQVLKADVIQKMREENLAYILSGGDKDQGEASVIHIDSKKSCKSRPRRKQNEPRSLKELLGGDR